MRRNGGIMSRGRKVFWGMIFIIGALALLVVKLGYLEGIGFWSILFTIALIGVLVDGVISKNFGQILFPLALLVIVHDELLGLEAITPWPVLGAALLGTIGLNMLFPNMGWKKWNPAGFQSEDVLDGETISFSNSFGESAKYLSGQEISKVRIKNSFGEMNVYFDGAILKNGVAEVYVENSFGETVLYIPKEWAVMNDIKAVFGDSGEQGPHIPDGSGTLHVYGKVDFGECAIRYL